MPLARIPSGTYHVELVDPRTDEVFHTIRWSGVEADKRAQTLCRRINDSANFNPPSQDSAALKEANRELSKLVEQYREELGRHDDFALSIRKALGFDPGDEGPSREDIFDLISTAVSDAKVYAELREELMTLTETSDVSVALDRVKDLQRRVGDSISTDELRTKLASLLPKEDPGEWSRDDLKSHIFDLFDEAHKPEEDKED